MKRVSFYRSIQLKFIIIYILLIVIAIQLIGSYVARELESELVSTFKETVNSRIDLLSYNVEQVFLKKRTDDPEEPTLQEDIQNIVLDIDRSNATIVQILSNQSRVLGTNDFLNNDTVGKKITDPLVTSAISFKTTQEKTLLNSKSGDRIYVVVEPIFDAENNVEGMIYYETSLENVYRQLSGINEIFLKGSLIALLVSALLGIFVARAITKPIIEMRRQAQTMARGDFSQKVNVYGTDEISQLAVTFNHLNDRLKHSIASTEKEQRKLSSVLEHMTEGVIATNQKGQITLINEAAGRLFNENPTKLINKDIVTLLDLDEKVADIIDLQESGSIVVDFTKDKDEVLLVRASFSAVYDQNPNLPPSGLIVVLSDVTEEENQEFERRQFVSNVSHELRTPLTTMKSYLEALMDGAWQDESIAPKFLEVTQTETERMIRMVNSLLQLSRIDSEKDSLHRQYLDFVPFYHQIIDRFEMKEKDGNISFNRQIPNLEFIVWIDRDKITQVLDNIISNAIKYSPDGGTVTLKVERKMRQIVVSIKDEGIGIEYDKLEKIFDRFYRVDKARTRNLGGTGLGLAISQEIVEMHYGQIWARSKEGKGTTIYFSLPLMNEKRGHNV